MTTATARLTLGTMFGAITTAATAATNVLTTASTGVNMLGAYADQAARHQTKTLLIEDAEFDIELANRIATERMNRQLELAKVLSTSPAHKALYEANYSDIMEILAKHNKGS